MDCCHIQRTKFSKDARCRFTNIQKQLPAPFGVYADFESILKPVNEDVDATQGVDTGVKSSSTVYQEHVPCSFAYKLVSIVDPDYSRPLVMYRGENAAEKFVRDLQQEAKQLFDEYIVTPNPMLFTATDLLSFRSADTCYICAKQLGDDKVRDHCHITGSYRGAAHSACNLMYRLIKSGWKLPVIIHNLKCYDGRLIVKALNSEFGKVRVIPQSMEKYLSLNVGQLKIIDSLQFTNQSLDSLANTLEDDEFRYLVESCTTSHFELVRRKGVHPYDYMDSFDIFEEIELPPRSQHMVFASSVKMRLGDLSGDDEDGYIYEVDLHYPTGLHNSHDDYPLAPESLVIDRAMYSPTQQFSIPRICTSEETDTESEG